MPTTTISGAGPHASAAATDRIPASKAGVKGYLTNSQIKDYILGLANTWTANGAASTPSQLLNGTWFAGGSATTTKPQFLIEPTGTTSTNWSTSGTGLGINAPSGFTGNLLDLQLAAAGRFAVASTGAITIANDVDLTHRFCGNSGVASIVAGAWSIVGGATVQLNTAQGFITFCNDIPLAFSAGAFTARDVVVARDAANVLALRRTTNAQTFRVYGTFTDASNYERGALNAGADYIELAAETAGTGDDNMDVRLTPAGTGNVRFGTHSAVGAETVTGFITVKDAAGNSRKLAVIS